MRTYALENRGRAPLYEYLYRCIRGDILDGTLTAGERLPSKRALAEHLHISVMTVEGAYQQLEAEGYVYTQPKRGFFVAEVERPRPAVPAPPAPEAPPEAPVWRLDLKSNQVDASRFPAAAWARLTRQVLSEDGEALLRPVPHQGLPALRQAIARDLREYKGMAVPPEQIVVGAGAEYLYAKNAAASGLDGVVCSPLEAALVKERCGADFLTVTPGIRFADSAAGDQKRIMTPEKAGKSGCDYIVVGRPITQAEDPVAAYRRAVKDFWG